MPELGDIVRYSAFGRTVNALVLAATTGDLSHQGAKGEPMLDLAYIDPFRESTIEKKQIGWHPRVFLEYSVVHASHEFSAAYKREKGISTPAQLAAQRGQGEWEEPQPLTLEQAIRIVEDRTHLKVVSDLAFEDFKRYCAAQVSPTGTVAIHVPIPKGDNNLEVQALEGAPAVPGSTQPAPEGE